MPIKRLLLFAALAMISSWVPLAVASNGDRIQWNSIGNGIALARKTNRKILIDFSADWCSCCAKMDSLYKRPLVAKWVMNNFVPVKCAPDKSFIDKAYFEGWGATSYPTTVVYDPCTNIAESFSGYIDDSVAFENKIVSLLLRQRDNTTSTSGQTDIDNKVVQAYSGIIASNPNLESYDQRAAANYRLGRFAEGTEDLQIMVATDPKKFEYRQALILFLDADKKRDEAIKVASEAIRDFANNPWLFNERGLLHMQTEETFDKALADFDKSIALDPNYPAPYCNKGTVHNAQKKYTSALEDFDTAISLNAKGGDYYSGRAIANAACGTVNLAIADSEQAISLSTNAANLDTQGYVFLAANKPEQALAAFEKALTMQTQFKYVTWLGMSKSYEKLGERELAQRYIEKATADSDICQRPAWVKAMLMFPLGKAVAARSSSPEAYEDSLEHWQAKLDVSDNLPGNAQPVVSLQAALQLQENSRQSTSANGNATDGGIGAKNATEQFGMEGLKALRQADYPLAIQLLESVVASDPENVNLQRSLAIAYNEYGQLLLNYDPATALENFQCAKKLWPENVMVPDSLEQAQKMFGGSLRSEAMRESATPQIRAATIAYVTPTMSRRANQPTKPSAKAPAEIWAKMDLAKLHKQSQSAVRESVLCMAPAVLSVPSAQADQNQYEATIRYNLGVKAEEAHDKLLAISYYKRACQFVPNFFSAHLRLGIIYQKQQDTFDALNQVKECLRIIPTDERAKELLSVLK